LSNPKFCVYTAITGDFEILNEQPAKKNSNIPFICFTDNSNTESSSWDIRTEPTLFKMDASRSQRYFKLLPHRVLPEFTHSLYIDNNIILKRSPEDIFEKYLAKDNFCLYQHGVRETVLDEFLEVSKLGLDEPSRVFEQLNHYLFHDAEVVSQKPYWCGLLLRHHEMPEIQKAMETWFYQVLRYSRRDQLSFNFAITKSQVKPIAINEGSDDSSWFHEHNYKTKRNLRSKARHQEYLLPSIERLNSLEKEYGKLINNLDKLPRIMKKILVKLNPDLKF